MPIGNITVLTPGSFHFIEGNTIVGGWTFHNDGDQPANEEEERTLIKKSIAAILDYIGGCLEMMNAPPPSISSSALSETLTRDLINRAKGL